MTLMTIIYEYEGHSSVPHKKKRKSWMEGGKEGNVLFNDALNTFYLRLYGVRHMVKDLSETHCLHIGYSFRLTARVILYAPSHRQDSTGWNET